MLPIVLASSSRYRAALLAKLGLVFTSCASAIDETPLCEENPEQTALRLAEAKARAISAQFPNHLIIGSDQVAVCGTQRLDKPGNRAAASQQLALQSGRISQFYTAVSVLNTGTNQCLSAIDCCQVHFKTLSPQQIERYLNTDQPFDCAGSFKSEALGIALFSKIEGDDPNALVGLPLIKLLDLLAQLGVSVL